MRTVVRKESNGVSAKVGSLEYHSKGFLAKLLKLELVVTVFLDTANELLGIFGVSLLMGQLVRSCFLVVNTLAVLEYGSRKDAQATVLMVVFFALETLREVFLGIDAIAYATVYWAKLFSYISMFFALKCAGLANAIDIDSIERFFKLSIMFIPLAYLVLSVLGVLDQRSFDLGYEGAILSKNSMSATLLLLFMVSLSFVSKRKLSFFWSIVIVATLFFLGSKATVFFLVITSIVCCLYELRHLSPRKMLVVGALLIGVSFVIWLFWDQVNLVIQSQVERYWYVVIQQGGSTIDFLLTGRNNLLEAGLTAYLDDMSPLALIMGSGISALSSGVASLVNAGGAFRGIEMDLFEITLASGAAGLCIAFIPFVMTLRVLREYHTTGLFHLKFGLLVVFCFMVLGGHVVTEGMSAAYLGAYLAYIYLLSKSSQRGIWHET